jgi:hypothetical protein
VNIEGDAQLQAIQLAQTAPIEEDPFYRAFLLGIEFSANGNRFGGWDNAVDWYNIVKQQYVESGHHNWRESNELPPDGTDAR